MKKQIPEITDYGLYVKSEQRDLDDVQEKGRKPTTEKSNARFLSLQLTCDKCQGKMKVPVSMLYKKVQCSTCKDWDKVTLSSDALWKLIICVLICISIGLGGGFVAGIIAFIISFFLCTAIPQIKDILREGREEERIRLYKERIKIRSDFPPPPECPKCSEDSWDLLETSPNYKSAIWKCGYCNKKVTIKSNSHSSKKKGGGRVIPKNIQMEVWRRDQGQCVECGSKDNIEYDHIIPWSKGGGNTARNIQLLCQKCNRNKSDKEPGTW